MKTLTQILGKCILATSLALSPLVIAGCDEYDNSQSNTEFEEDIITEETEETGPYWPTEKAKDGDTLTALDNIYFSTNYAGIGNFELGMWDARWLRNNYGFQVYQGHVGGYGDTLEVTSPQNGIYMAWAYNALMNIAVSQQWKGEIFESGVKVGDKIGKFLEAYPDAKRGNTSQYGGGNHCYRTALLYDSFISSYNGELIERYYCLTADVDNLSANGGNIIRLRLDEYNPDYFGYNGP